MSSGARAVGLLGVHRGEERTYRVGDCAGGPPGQVMAGAVDQLEASVRQRLRQTASGLDGDQGVPRVGEDEHWHLDRGEGTFQLVELAQQGALLREERAPERAARVIVCGPRPASSRARPGAGCGRPDRRATASRARAIHGVSFHATKAHSGPVPGAASTLSHTFAHPGPTLASRTTASTRSGARLAADIATPPPNECPTSTARSMPRASRSSMTARALAANPPAGS